MNYSEDYKFIDINNVSIAYTDRGKGQPVLFVHGFAAFSYSWMKMIEHLPQDLRFISMDLKGFGYSEKKCDDNLAPFDQAEIIAEFINKMGLEDVILVGHSMGGTICLLTLFNAPIMAKVSKLILLNSATLFQKLPDFIDDLTSISPNNLLIKLVNEELMASFVLKQSFFDETKITQEMLKEYGHILKQENAKECIISAAKQIAIANIRSFHDNIKKITIPTLIIWGDNDTIIDIEDALALQKYLRNSKLEIIPNCGHSPQEEMPAETAAIITEFLESPFAERQNATLSELNKALEEPQEDEKPATEGNNKLSRSVDQFMQVSGDYIQKLKMRKLIDRWTLGTFLLIIFMKILQFMKKLGFHAEENGWRKATGIFLRNEHSKFILTSFRLNYTGEQHSIPETIDAAKNILIDRLAVFLRRNPACHWTLEWGFFMAKRKKLFFTDIIEVEFDNDGKLQKLQPYFDKTRATFAMLNDEIIKDACEKFIETYNEFKSTDDHKRAWIIFKKLRRWARKYKGLSFSGKYELRYLIERIMNASFIQFETISDNPEKLTGNRLSTPNLKNRKHPGFGMLNIVCRFTADLKEADLWFQHHHVSVDGMPMQEMLQQLKKEWGSVGPVKYPALSSEAAKPEVFYFGHKIFRARIYVSFERFIKLRKHLNDKYYAQMGGPATVSSMMIWGLAQQKFFRDRKFLFPVDTALITEQPPQDKNISLIFIRPSKFFNTQDPLEGFLKYQREFNQRLFATRLGKSESYEMLELYAMTHPLFYYIARYLMTKAMGEVVGTAGLTILKDAEMFVSPLTDLQFNGFVAMGNMMMPTEDGKTSGAVSICGSRKQVREYIKAIYHLADYYPDYLKIELLNDSTPENQSPSLQEIYE